MFFVFEACCACKDHGEAEVRVDRAGLVVLQAQDEGAGIGGSWVESEPGGDWERPTRTDEVHRCACEFEFRIRRGVCLRRLVSAIEGLVVARQGLGPVSREGNGGVRVVDCNVGGACAR